MVVLSILRDNALLYRRNLMRFLTAAAVYLFAELILAGALLGIIILTFIFLLLAGLVKSLLAAQLMLVLTLASLFILVCFMNAFRGGFYNACQSIQMSRPETPIEFLDYSLRRLPTFSILMMLQLCLALAIALPFAGLNYFIHNDLLLYASALAVLAIFMTLSIPFELAIPAVVVDNVGWLTALSRAFKTTFSNLTTFIPLFLILKLAEGVSAFIPLVGLFLTLLVVLPIADSSLIMFYRSRRAA